MELAKKKAQSAKAASLAAFSFSRHQHHAGAAGAAGGKDDALRMPSPPKTGYPRSWPRPRMAPDFNNGVEQLSVAVAKTKTLLAELKGSGAFDPPKAPISPKGGLVAGLEDKLETMNYRFDQKLEKKVKMIEHGWGVKDDLGEAAKFAEAEKKRKEEEARRNAEDQDAEKIIPMPEEAAPEAADDPWGKSPHKCAPCTVFRC